MTASIGSLTVDDRIAAVEKELRSLTVAVRENEQARKSLMAVSQRAVNDLELGPDAIWRLIMQVT